MHPFVEYASMLFQDAAPVDLDFIYDDSDHFVSELAGKRLRFIFVSDHVAVCQMGNI